MNSILFNKIAGATLGTIFVVLGLSFLSEMIFTSHPPEKPGFAIEVEGDDGGEEAAATEEAEETPSIEPVAGLLADADIDAGKKLSKKCAACHTFDKGGKKKVGPNLYGIVDRTVATGEGFGYSAALEEWGDGKSWTYAELNGFLEKPKKYVKGTSMGFAGLKKTEDRAAMIAYLRMLADEPAPLPSE